MTPAIVISSPDDHQLRSVNRDLAAPTMKCATRETIAAQITQAKPAVTTKLDPPGAPETPATIPKTAASPSLARYTAPEIQLEPVLCQVSRPRMRLSRPCGSSPGTAGGAADRLSSTARAC